MELVKRIIIKLLSTTNDLLLVWANYGPGWIDSADISIFVTSKGSVHTFVMKFGFPWVVKNSVSSALIS